MKWCRADCAMPYIYTSISTTELLMNKDLIAIDQDKLGVQGLKVAAQDSLELRIRPLDHDDWAFCILNRDKEAKQYTIDWQNFNLYDDVAYKSTNFVCHEYKVYNLWTNKLEGNTSKIKTITIPGHDVQIYRLYYK